MKTELELTDKLSLISFVIRDEESEDKVTVQLDDKGQVDPSKYEDFIERAVNRFREDLRYGIEYALTYLDGDYTHDRKTFEYQLDCDFVSYTKDRADGDD